MDTVYLSPIVSAISVLVAIALGVAGFRASHHSRQRQHSVALLSNLTTNDALARASLDLYTAIEGHIPFEKLDEDAKVRLWRLVNFFDFVAVAAISVEIDRTLVKYHCGSRIVQLYNYMQEPIVTRRKLIDRPHLYESFEELARQHQGGKFLPGSWLGSA